MRLSPALAALIAAAVGAAPAWAEPPVWTVRDADTEMVLFGSVHSLPPEIQWRTPALDAALAEADLVAFEILEPEDEAAEMAMFMPVLPYMISTQPLSTLVSPETFARVRAAAAEQEVEVGMLEMMRPWAAALMLSIGADESQGRTGDLGVDTVLEGELAEDRRKEALDTPELLLSAIQALAAMDAEEGEQMLVESLDAMDEDELDLSLETAWAAGDLGPLRQEVEDMRTEAPRLYRAMLIDRNTGWMPALKRMMETEGKVLVVAGAAHMVGPDGLPTLLRQAGYEVEGPE